MDGEADRGADGHIARRVGPTRGVPSNGDSSWIRLPRRYDPTLIPCTLSLGPVYGYVRHLCNIVHTAFHSFIHAHTLLGNSVVAFVFVVYTHIDL